MKKYFQSLGYMLFLGISSYAIITAIKSYEKPFSLYENPLVWIALVALILVILLKEFLNINSCKFNNCTHNHEPNCEIKKSVDNGLISRSRYNNYISMLLETENSFR